MPPRAFLMSLALHAVAGAALVAAARVPMRAGKGALVTVEIAVSEQAAVDEGARVASREELLPEPAAAHALEARAVTRSAPSRRPAAAGVTEAERPTSGVEIAAPAGPAAAVPSAATAAAGVVDGSPSPRPAVVEPRGEPRPGPLLIPDGAGRLRHERETFVARVAADGTVSFNDRENLQLDGLVVDERGPALGGRFDLTDWAMRSHGDDPYRYEKAKFLEQTRATRERMAAAATVERRREALVALPGLLARIWRHSAWTAAQRRRALFELWDGCAEDGEPEVARAGAEARATIAAFMRRQLPCGGDDAFTADELATLNGSRRSRAAFDPCAE